MAKLSDQAIDKINDQVDFSQLFRMGSLQKTEKIVR